MAAAGTCILSHEVVAAAQQNAAEYRPPAAVTAKQLENTTALLARTPTQPLKTIPAIVVVVGQKTRSVSAS